MIKKILVNSWMLNDHYPTDPGTIFILDFNVGNETEYYYSDVLPNLGRHYYDYNSKEDDDDNIVDISDIGIGFLESAIECEFKDFPEEINVYLINKNMTVKAYLIKRFCIDKESIPETVEPTREQKIELWKKKECNLKYLYNI
ncbi:hypothetical protein WKS98_00605 [Lagierella sp. ICN-221743]